MLDRTNRVGILPILQCASALLLLHCALLTGQSRAEVIPLNIENTTTAARSGHPVTSGVPFPKGALTSASNVRILDSNRVEIPSQTQVLATWDKGGSSIKWILFDFQANVAAQSSSTYYVEYGPTVVRKSFSADLNVSQLSDRITVRTGPLSFSIRKDRFNFLDEASINGISIITPSHGQDFYVQDQDGMVYKASNPLSDYTVTVEDAGPLRAQIKCAGWFVSDTGEKRFKYEVRFQAYAGKPILRVYSTVIFTEDMFKYRLKDVALKTPLSLSGSLTYAIGGESKVAAGILNRDIHLLQDDYNHYSIKNIAGAVVQEGSKSAGWLDLSASDSSAGITAFIRDMWQAYPMELEANGNSLIAHLWPAHADFTSQVAAKKVLAAKKTIGHFWPFHGGGELNLQAISPDPNESGCSPDNPEACLYYDNLRNAAGISKTYELVYYFHNGGHSDANSPSVIEAYGNELMAINGSWVSQTEAFGKMHPYDPDNFSSAEDVLQKAFASIVKSQQSRADYGMVNYGDAHYGYSAAGSGHRYWLDWRVNWQNSLWILYARSGNPDYLNFAIASTRHVMDIDTAQVDLSFTDINGNKVTKDAGCMIRTHEIGASHWHSNSSGWPDTQMDGNIDPLLAYYYLTGYRRARDVAEMRAKQVLNSVSEYNAWPAARTAAGALGVPLEMYQLTWDEKYLNSANTTFAIILAKLPRPDGYWGRSAINWDVMTTTWIPAQFEKYCRISGNAAAKKEFLRVAKALGGLGLTEDTNGTRTYGYPFRLYSYAYELTGDVQYLKYGKYFYDLALPNADKDLGLRGGSPDTHQIFRFIQNLPYLMHSLYLHSGAIDAPELPVLFTSIGKEGTDKTVYSVKEDTDKEITFKIFAQPGTNFFVGWIDSGNVYIRVFDPTGRVVVNDSFTMPLKYALQFENGSDQRIKTYTLPQDGKTGIYTIEVTADNPSHSTGGPAVVALLANSAKKTVINVPESGIRLDRGRYYFYVDPNCSQFKLRSADWAPFILFRPNGDKYSAPTYSYTVSPSSGEKGSLWSIGLSNDMPAFTRIYIDSGISKYFALSPQSSFEYTPPTDSTAPSAPGNLAGSSNSASQIALTWSAATDPESGVANYRIYRNGAVVGSPSGTTFQDTGLSAATAYSYQVSAVNRAGMEGAKTGAVSVTTSAGGSADQTPPSAPGNLASSGTSASQVSLTWSASADPESGVASYRVYRNGVPVGSPAALSFQDSGLSSSTSYSYQVSAVNGSSLEGVKSNILTITTPSSTPVTPPGSSPQWLSSNTGVQGLKIVSDRWISSSTLKDFGESAARLMNAATNEEKALALFRYIQQSTMIIGTVPKEPAYGNTDVVDPMKQLNVYGAHWCDGFTRLMETTWRALGYRAHKLYKFGHTLADIHYKDLDGVERWHVFDNSAYHWYLYNRDGSHIATPEELILDWSLSGHPSKPPKPDTTSFPVPGYIHESHLKESSYSALINLRNHESVRLYWGNVGKPYYNPTGVDVGGLDFEHGPYQKTYGNAEWSYNPDFTGLSYTDGLASVPENVASIAQDGKSPNLHPAQPGRAGTIIYHFAYPYIISEATISGSFKRAGINDSINIYISKDKSNWKKVWSAGGTGVFSIQEVSISESFNINQTYPSGLITPFGHYSYYLKIEMLAATDVSNCGLSNLVVKTTTQHNIFSLPQLWPVRNSIAVSGSINDDTSLKITYRWDDLRGTNRENVTIAESLPFSYPILADGTKWEDVLCNNILIEAVPRVGRGNRVLVQETPPTHSVDIRPLDAFPTSKILGSQTVSTLSNTQYYIDQIRSGIAGNDFTKIHGALTALAVLRDPAAKQALLDVIYLPKSYKYYTRYRACLALYLTVGAGAAPAMIDILERDPAIGWTDTTGEFDDDSNWIWVSQIAAFILADINNAEARNAVNLIADLVHIPTLKAKLNGRDPWSIYRYSEIRWGFIKGLGILGGPAQVPLLLGDITPEWTGESSYVAVSALGNIGDKSAIPAILTLMDRAIRQASARMKILNSIEALGKLGDASIAPQLFSFLSDWDENLRGYTAIALGKLGNKDAIPHLESLLQEESFPWVREAALQSITKLRNPGFAPSAPRSLKSTIVVR